MADALDSKSCARKGVWVQLPPLVLLADSKLSSAGSVASAAGFFVTVPRYAAIRFSWSWALSLRWYTSVVVKLGRQAEADEVERLLAVYRARLVSCCKPSCCGPRQSYRQDRTASGNGGRVRLPQRESRAKSLAWRIQGRRTVILRDLYANFWREDTT
jgi:hypothetical protein